MHDNGLTWKIYKKGLDKGIEFSKKNYILLIDKRQLINHVAYQ